MRTRTLCSLSFVLLAACPGKAPPIDEAPDGGVDAAPGIGQRVSGKTMDYFVANTPLADSAVTTDGIDPPLTVTSAADGVYALEAVPPGSKMFLSVERTGYRPTRNALVSVEEAAVEQDVYVLANTDVQRQYATDGKLPTPGTAFVAAELLRNNGAPLIDVPLADVVLVDAADAPVPGVIGPWVFGALGDVVPVGPTVTEAHNGSARVAFLDVPPGAYSLKVTFLDGEGAPQTLTTSVVALADGATLVRSGGGGGGGGGNPASPRFAADIYPRLQTAAKGGLGCGNCHHATGAASLLVMDALPAEVLTAMTAKLGIIDLAEPEASLLLRKPLYEAPPALPDHPNATFVDINDNDYKLIMLWIQQGAML